MEDVDTLREQWEHLMFGKGWARLNVEVPTLRKQDYQAPEGKGKWKKYEGCTNAEEARLLLHQQEMVIGTWEGTNLTSSQCTDGFHRLCIDVDKKVEVLVSDFTDAILVADPGTHMEYEGQLGNFKQKKVPNVPEPVAIKGNVFVVESSTPDHFHVYSDHPYTWGEYHQVLDLLRISRVIESGYFYYSVERGFTAVRKPWVRKLGTPPPKKEEMEVPF